MCQAASTRPGDSSVYQSGRAGPGPDGNTCDWSSVTGPHDQVTAVCISQVELALDLMVIPVAGLQ